MEKAMIKALLEKYWQAETTLEEEKVLADYFRDDPDPELAPYRDLFLYFAQEAQVTAGPDLETRILQKVGLAARPVRTYRLGFIAAAAAIGAIVAGFFLLTPRRTHRGAATVASVTIKDTYDDPEQAMAAVRHALLVASTHLNEGRESLTGSKK